MTSGSMEDVILGKRRFINGSWYRPYQLWSNATRRQMQVLWEQLQTAVTFELGDPIQLDAVAETNWTFLEDYIKHDLIKNSSIVIQKTIKPKHQCSKQASCVNSIGK